MTAAVNRERTMNREDNVVHPNKFQELISADQDDEDAAIDALREMASKVQVGPKPSQKSLRSLKKPKPLTEAKIASIVAQLDSGTLRLEDLDDVDCSDDDYITVYCRMDSGSTVNIADQTKHFPGALVTKGKKTGTAYMAANKGKIINRGEMIIRGRTEEGVKATVT